METSKESIIESSPTNQIETNKESISDCSPPQPKKLKLEVDFIKQEVEPENNENDSNAENICETKMQVDEIKSTNSPTTSILSDKLKDKDFDEKKNVKFSESTLDFSESNTAEMKERVKLNRAKSCVVVKRLVVKSRLPTKTNL